MSALPENVTWLPTAQAEPVQQLPRRGRFPKSIGRYWDARYKQLLAQYEERQRQAEVNKLDEEWWQALNHLQWCEIRMRELGALPTRFHKKFT